MTNQVGRAWTGRPTVVIWCSMPWPLSVGSLSSLPFTLIKTILQLLTRKNGGHGQSQRRKGDIKNKPKLSRNKAFHSVNCDEHALKHTSCPHDSTRPSQTRASDLAELPCRERWGKSARRAELDSKTLQQDYMSLRWLNHRHRSLSSTNHKTSKLLSVSLGVGHQTRTVVKNLPALQENNGHATGNFSAFCFHIPPGSLGDSCWSAFCRRTGKHQPWKSLDGLVLAVQKLFGTVQTVLGFASWGWHKIGPEVCP